MRVQPRCCRFDLRQSVLLFLPHGRRDEENRAGGAPRNGRGDATDQRTSYCTVAVRSQNDQIVMFIPDGAQDLLCSSFSPAYFFANIDRSVGTEAGIRLFDVSVQLRRDVGAINRNIFEVEDARDDMKHTQFRCVAGVSGVRAQCIRPLQRDVERAERRRGQVERYEHAAEWERKRASYDEAWDRGGSDDPIGSTAEERSTVGSLAVRSEDNQIGANITGPVENRLVRDEDDDLTAGDFNTGGHGAADLMVERVVGGVNVPLERPGLQVIGGVRQRMEVECVQDVKLGIDESGKCRSCAKDVIR